MTLQNDVIKCPMYFTSHMRITGQIMKIIHEWVNVLIQHRDAY